MTKNDFIKELNDAKAAHISWHAAAQALAMGTAAGNERVPTLYTDCQFGRWYYGAGHFLNFMAEFKEIEPIHEKLHKIYMQIYQKYIEPARKGLFTSSQKAEMAKTKEMETMVSQLKEISNVMIEKLSKVQSNLNAMNDDELQRRLVF